MEAAASVKKSLTSWVTTRGQPLVVVVPGLGGVVVVAFGPAVVAVVEVVVFPRKFLVAKPTKNVTDPLLAFVAPNCLKNREYDTMS